MTDWTDPSDNPERQAELAAALFGPTPRVERPRRSWRHSPASEATPELPLPTPQLGTKRRLRRVATEISVTLALSLVIAWVLNAFVLQTFLIPSGSMASTLNVGDRIVVSRLTPELFDVHRGDVVVFKDTEGWLQESATPTVAMPSLVSRVLRSIGLSPNADQQYLVKRVIGVGGDTVASDGSGPVTVNGMVLDETYLDPGVEGSTTPFSVTVPPGCLWVMGDNRDHSADSRAHTDDTNGGCVPLEHVFGVAVAKVFPLKSITLLRNPQGVFTAVPAPSADH